MSKSAEDFLAEFLALLPRGPVWPRDPASILSQVVASLMPTWARLAAADAALLVDAFPSSTVDLLPEWESTLGLPDPCAGPDPAIADRQAQVLARFATEPGQSVPALTAYAAALGIAITVTEFIPRRFGTAFGAPMLGTAWAFAWQVNAPSLTITRRQFGQAFGLPYSVLSSTVLQCELERLKPAHTILVFAYA